MSIQKSQYVKTIIVASMLMITSTLLFTSYTSNVEAFPKEMLQGNYSFGKINSIQNDGEGKPAWIVSGHWKTNLLNSTETDSQNNGTIFDTSFEMIRLDGTNGHTHTITNFNLTSSSNPNNMTTIINGTSTISMKENPITDIPTSITVANNKVISIWLDPNMINNHFGNTPLYGLVKSDDYKGKR